MPNCWKKCCKFCDSFFKTSKQLAKHYRKEHLDKMFICHHCDKAFMSDNKRKAHELKYHQDEESDEEDEENIYNCEESDEGTDFECEDCDKIFPSIELFQDHPCPIDEADEEVDAFKIAIESEMKEEAEKNKIAESELKEEPQQISVVLGVPQEDEREEGEEFDVEAELLILARCQRRVDEARRDRRVKLRELRAKMTKDHPDFMRFVEENLNQRDEQKRMWKYGIKPKK